MIHVPLLLPVVGTTLKTGLVSVWEFNELSGVTAFDAHGAHDGTNNGADINQSGLSNLTPCYDFVNANSDYINMGNSSDFNFPTSDFSLSIWTNTADTDGLFISKRDVGAATFEGYVMYISSDKARILLSDGATNKFATSTTTINNSAWHLITSVRDGDNLKIYVDGGSAEETITGVDTHDIGNSVNFLVGFQTNGASGNYLDGKADQPTVWNRALTDAEIAILYNSGNGLAYINW